VSIMVQAQSEFIMFLDDDDELKEGAGAIIGA
jgi:hypothetical protein